MRVYVATSFVNVAEARHWLAQLRAIGITISHDWTEEGKSIQPPLRSETELPLETQRALAMADIEGIRTADVFWLLSPATGGVGCWFESGAAFWMSMNPGHGPKIISSGFRRSIFQSLRDHYDTHETAFAFLADAHERGAYTSSP